MFVFFKIYDRNLFFLGHFLYLNQLQTIINITDRLNTSSPAQSVKQQDIHMMSFFPREEIIFKRWRYIDSSGTLMRKSLMIYVKKQFYQ